MAIVSKSSTIAEAAAACLPTVQIRAENGMLCWSAYENPEHTGWKNPHIEGLPVYGLYP